MPNDGKKNIETKLYQVQVWHKNFPDLLNVVVIVKKNPSLSPSIRPCRENRASNHGAI
jgi:hypothetical protein